MNDELRERMYETVTSLELDLYKGERWNIVDAIIIDLGLREEWVARHESGGGTVYATEQQAREDLASFTYRPPGADDPGSGRLVGIERRYVTDWEAFE